MAFALQLKKKHGKTSVRVAEELKTLKYTSHYNGCEISTFTI
jgi:hypothetical protein